MYVICTCTQDVPYDPQPSKSGGRAMSPLATEGDGSHSNRTPVTPAKVNITHMPNTQFLKYISYVCSLN